MMMNTSFNMNADVKYIMQNNTSIDMTKKLLEKYDKIMLLKIYIKDDELRNKYNENIIKHNNKIINSFDFIDAGFDLFLPEGFDSLLSEYKQFKICFAVNYKINCSAKILTDTGKSYNTGYYIHPRSSLSLTPLRLANSTGIIDAGYRGDLIGMFDVNENTKYSYKTHDRYVQICAPGLIPIICELVNSIDELSEVTQRGNGGFGSTGK